MTSRWIESRIMALLHMRRPDATICPSEVLEGPDKKDRDKMAAVRSVARDLHRERRIQIVQKGKVIDPDSIHGPIRLRLFKASES